MTGEKHRDAEAPREAQRSARSLSPAAGRPGSPRGRSRRPRARAAAHLPRDPALRLTYCAPRSAVQAASRALRLVLMRPPAATVAQHPLSPPASPAAPRPAVPREPTCAARLVPHGDPLPRRPPQQRRASAARQPRTHHQHPRHRLGEGRRRTPPHCALRGAADRRVPARC